MVAEWSIHADKQIQIKFSHLLNICLDKKLSICPLGFAPLAPSGRHTGSVVEEVIMNSTNIAPRFSTLQWVTLTLNGKYRYNVRD